MAAVAWGTYDSQRRTELRNTLEQKKKRQDAKREKEERDKAIGSEERRKQQRKAARVNTVSELVRKKCKNWSHRHVSSRAVRHVYELTHKLVQKAIQLMEADLSDEIDDSASPPHQIEMYIDAAVEFWLKDSAFSVSLCCCRTYHLLPVDWCLTEQRNELVNAIVAAHSSEDVFKASNDTFSEWVKGTFFSLADHAVFHGVRMVKQTKHILSWGAWSVDPRSYKAGRGDQSYRGILNVIEALEPSQERAIIDEILADRSLIHLAFEMKIPEEQQRARDAVRRCLVEAIRRIQQKGDEAFDGVAVAKGRLEVCLGERVRRFKSVHDLCNNLTPAQSAVVVKKITGSHSVSEILLELAGGNVDRFIRDAIKAAVSVSDPAFSCPICYEGLNPLDDDPKNAPWRPLPKRAESWSKKPCDHFFCHDCARAWCETRIGEMQHHIRCPAEGCSYHLWKDDVKSLVSSEVYDTFQKNRNADYMGHLKATLNEADDGGSLKKWLRKHARPCPKCHVIVSRSNGCDDMHCVCGCKFCYRCGRKSCKCSVNRKNIWDVVVKKK